MATTLVYAPRAANTPDESAAPEYPANLSATVEALGAHVELIADLLTAFGGDNPPPSRSNWAGGLEAPQLLGSMSRTAHIATLLESLGSGNCRLDHLVRILAAQFGSRQERGALWANLKRS